MTGLRRFRRPYDWPVVDGIVRDDGVVVLGNLLPQNWCRRALAQIDNWLAQHPHDPGITRGPYWLWIDSIVDRLPFAAELVRTITPNNELVTAVYRARLPGETAETARFHRGDDTLSGYAIVALGRLTVHNGSPWFAVRSHHLPRGVEPEPGSLVRATLEPGDTALYRSDVLHRIGANTTRGDVLHTVTIGYRERGGHRA